ncbi:hypothetical protein EMIT0P2_10540 [Pseudomonas sp. IT-P2]
MYFPQNAESLPAICFCLEKVFVHSLSLPSSSLIYRDSCWKAPHITGAQGLEHEQII